MKGQENSSFNIETLNSADIMFPTAEKFEKVFAEKMNKGNAIPWRDLPVNNVYKVEAIQKVTNTKFGDAAILQLRTIDGVEIEVWATQLLANELNEMNLPCFVKPCGLRESKRNVGRSYQSYKLLTDDELRDD